MQGVRKHLTYANVMATLAMFAVLGGGAYAAKKIGSSDIKKNAVRSKHIKKNNVKSSDIGKNQVKSSDIKNGKVKASDIKDGDVGSTDLADGGIAGIDVASNALGGTQINEGSLGKVPSAVTADNVTGTKIRAFDSVTNGVFPSGPDSGVTTILDEDNFVLKVRCLVGGLTTIQLMVETKVDNAEVRSFFIHGPTSEVEREVNPDLDIGQTFDVHGGPKEDIVGTFEYRNGGLNVVSMQFQATKENATNECRASGHVLLS